MLILLLIIGVEYGFESGNKGWREGNGPNTKVASCTYHREQFPFNNFEE